MKNHLSRLMTAPIAKFLSVLAFGAATSAAVAQTQAVFDFESLAPTTDGGQSPDPGGVLQLDLESNGVALHIEREGGFGFDIVDDANIGHNGFALPADFGSRSLSTFANQATGPGVLFVFQEPVSSFAITAGNFGGFPEMTLDALDAVGGTVVASTAVTPVSAAEDNWTGSTLSLSGEFTVFRLTSAVNDLGFATNLYADNVTVGFDPSSSGEGFSSEGREFLLAFQQNSTPNDGATLQLLISSRTDTNGHIAIPGLSFTQTFDVTAGSVTTVTIPRPCLTARMFGA